MDRKSQTTNKDAMSERERGLQSERKEKVSNSNCIGKGRGETWTGEVVDEEKILIQLYRRKTDG